MRLVFEFARMWFALGDKICYNILVNIKIINMPFNFFKRNNEIQQDNDNSITRNNILNSLNGSPLKVPIDLNIEKAIRLSRRQLRKVRKH